MIAQLLSEICSNLDTGAARKKVPRRAMLVWKRAALCGFDRCASCGLLHGLTILIWTFECMVFFDFASFCQTFVDLRPSVRPAREQCCCVALSPFNASKNHSLACDATHLVVLTSFLATFKLLLSM